MTDADDGDNELLRVENEIAGLQMAIELDAEGGYGRTRDHYALQHDLKVLWHRQAQLEESIRIEEVRHDAVESGLVITPTAYRDFGDCPLCMEDISYLRLPTTTICCGQWICSDCAADPRTLNVCPFCRAKFPTEEEQHPMKRAHAKKGKLWAQYEIGSDLFHGHGVEQDIEASMLWFTMASQQGHVDSMLYMAGAMFYGLGLPISFERAFEWTVRAARLGSAFAQLQCGMTSAERGKMTESLQWYTLSAAQGISVAQRELGRLFLEGESTLISSSPFKAYYWFKKAALQGDCIAQRCMASLILKIARTVHGGDITIPGYCPLPEAYVWMQKYYDGKERDGLPVNLSRSDYVQFVCACCNAKESATVKISRCVQCQLFGYCSEKCRWIHWELGHEADCNRAHKLKQSLSASGTSS